MASPLQQFEIAHVIRLPEIAGVDISITNSGIAMIASMVFVILLMTLSMRGRALVPGRWQSIAELSYEFIGGMIRENIGEEGRPYFPLILTLFMFILAGNVLGMLPYSFTWTSHIIATFALASAIFVGVTILGFIKHGLHFLTFFSPSGVPKVMLVLLIPIEVISYLSRPISLSVRLFANMLAGHTLLKVIGGFVFGLGSITFGIGGLLPIALLVALTGLEMVIAFLQAYVFAILTCLYINDALNMH